VTGTTGTGGRVETTLLLRLLSSPPLTLGISPNPIRSTGVLSFTTTRSGPITVRLFDCSGRTVRDLYITSISVAGYHDVVLDGYDNKGRRLASGIYFLRVDTGDGTAARQVIFLR